MDNLQRTPLYDFHVAAGARMVPFAGWEMPVQYTSILEEHRSVREAVGLFDVSHMGEATVKGPDALAYLNQLVTNDVGRLVPGKALYTVMCYPEGGVVDDLIIMMLAENDYLLCINASNAVGDVRWMLDHTDGFDVEVEDVSSKWAQLAVQGPKAEALLGELTGADLPNLGRFATTNATVAGVEALIARTGYTGEDGFEVYTAAADATAVAEALVAKGESYGLHLCGLGSRDSLRTEAGYPLYGHELSESINPLEAGLGWVVKLKKTGDFIGKSVLLEQKAAGPSRKLVWFRLEGRRIARQGTPVLDAAGEAVGEVVSGTLSPLLNQPIGSALVQTAAVGTELAVDLRGNRMVLDVAKPPLHVS